MDFHVHVSLPEATATLWQTYIDMENHYFFIGKINYKLIIFNSKTHRPLGSAKLQLHQLPRAPFIQHAVEPARNAGSAAGPCRWKDHGKSKSIPHMEDSLGFKML
jgi:hypothetical protein